MKIQVEKSAFLLKAAAFALCVFSFLFSFSQENKRVLFVGNSYTQVNNLPEEFMRVAQSQDKRVECQMQAFGGATFSSHCNNPSTIEAITQGGWDYIVLQGQSQEVAFPDNQFSWQVYPYAKTLDSLAKAYNPDVKVVFYMTWGYRYGDELNCQFYEPFCTFESMSERLRDNYVLMAEDFGSDVSPVGVAWLESFRRDSTVVLHSSDNSHPNIKEHILQLAASMKSYSPKDCTRHIILRPCLLRWQHIFKILPTERCMTILADGAFQKRMPLLLRQSKKQSRSLNAKRSETQF